MPARDTGPSLHRRVSLPSSILPISLTEKRASVTRDRRFRLSVHPLPVFIDFGVLLRGPPLAPPSPACPSVRILPLSLRCLMLMILLVDIDAWYALPPAHEGWPTSPPAASNSSNADPGAWGSGSGWGSGEGWDDVVLDTSVVWSTGNWGNLAAASSNPSVGGDA
ncbi:hypothetical protein B0H11DRAFT_2257929 [Mycena galericulata]|nr:hypothetical protein B0H11DRAFT_2257929 [Mycena galericulata]